MISSLHTDSHLWPLLATILLWWGGTGVVLVLVRARRHGPRVFLLSSCAAVLALFGVAALGDRNDAIGAILSFTCGLVVWGWNEIAFLMGRITGPRSTSCAEGCSGPRHVLHAISAILYHELALLASAAALLFLSRGAENAVGAQAFLILWIMRVSAKLNLFLGVRNLAVEWLPLELQHLRPYLRRAPVNLLFPFSITGATLLMGHLVRQALSPEVDRATAGQSTMLATLAFLGLLEHWLLVLPVDPTRPWRWSTADGARS